MKEPCSNMYSTYFRRNTNRQRADEQLDRLKDQLLLQQFLQECDEVCRDTLVAFFMLLDFVFFMFLGLYSPRFIYSNMVYTKFLVSLVKIMSKYSNAFGKCFPECVLACVATNCLWHKDTHSTHGLHWCTVLIIR